MLDPGAEDEPDEEAHAVTTNRSGHVTNLVPKGPSSRFTRRAHRQARPTDGYGCYQRSLTEATGSLKCELYRPAGPALEDPVCVFVAKFARGNMSSAAFRARLQLIVRGQH